MPVDSMLVSILPPLKLHVIGSIKVLAPCLRPQDGALAHHTATLVATVIMRLADVAIMFTCC